MKKLLFLFLISIMSLSSHCQPGHPETTGKALIEDLKNKKLKFKFKNIIWGTFDKAGMLSLYQDPHVLSIKFFVGVFPSTDPDVKKQNAPVIILQVKRDDLPLARGKFITGYVYYSGSSLCPPPNDGTCGNVE